MALTKNQLLIMMSSVRMLERDIQTLQTIRESLGINPTDVERMGIAIGHMRNEINLLRVTIDSQLSLLENQ